MARENTTNLGLVKPDKTDQYNVADFNDNMQKIDDFAGLTPPRALTADKLTVGRNINGVLFDGTEDIVIKTGGEDKLNITLDNATQTTKETIVDYNGIDYDMGIDIPSSQLFTPEKDGVIISFAEASYTGTGVDIYRGNSTAGENKIGVAYSSRNSATFGSSEIRVTKGKEYNIVMYNAGETICKFYPCNGVKE